MIRSLWDILYSSQACDFKSAFGVAESVARLRAATSRFGLDALFRQAAVGPVSESRVRLARVMPLYRNDLKPCFHGRFEQRADGVYLTGRFQLAWSTRVFTSIWLAMFAVIILILLAGLPDNWQAALGGSGMFVAVVAFIALGRWLARNDVAWLSQLIREALGTPQAPVSPMDPFHG